MYAFWTYMDTAGVGSYCAAGSQVADVFLLSLRLELGRVRIFRLPLSAARGFATGACRIVCSCFFTTGFHAILRCNLPAICRAPSTTSRSKARDPSASTSQHTTPSPSQPTRSLRSTPSLSALSVPSLDSLEVLQWSRHWELSKRPL